MTGMPQTALGTPEAFVQHLLNLVFDSVPQARQFAKHLLATCAIRVRDMIDHIALPYDAEFAERGWRCEGESVWRAPNALLPVLVESPRLAIALRVECVERFLAATGVDARIEGAAHGPYRSARVFEGGGVGVLAVERRGWRGFSPPEPGARKIRRARIHQQIFRTRRRQFQNPTRGLAHLGRLAEAAAADLGAGWAGALFLRAEREYWLTRSAYAFIQHQRQAAAGVGWCTVNHHAYACSREHFSDTIDILRTLGHSPLDIIRPSTERDWAAQVLDAAPIGCALHTIVGVDLAPHETRGSGALSPLTRHSLPGLWCALHGESALDAGLHSVSAAYDETWLAADAGDPGSGSRRRVVRDEPRAVEPRRVELLERAEYITRPQAEAYRLCGADGAHFEITARTNETALQPPAFAVDPPVSDVEDLTQRRRRTRAKRSRLRRELPLASHA